MYVSVHMYICTCVWSSKWLFNTTTTDHPPTIIYIIHMGYLMSPLPHFPFPLPLLFFRFPPPIYSFIHITILAPASPHLSLLSIPPTHPTTTTTTTIYICIHIFPPLPPPLFRFFYTTYPPTITITIYSFQITISLPLIFRSFEYHLPPTTIYIY